MLSKVGNAIKEIFKPSDQKKLEAVLTFEGFEKWVDEHLEDNPQASAGIVIDARACPIAMYLKEHFGTRYVPVVGIFDACLIRSSNAMAKLTPHEMPELRMPNRLLQVRRMVDDYAGAQVSFSFVKQIVERVKAEYPQ